MKRCNYLYYCKKCGMQMYGHSDEENICFCCGSVLYPVPDKYMMDEFDIKKGKEEQFINEYIKSSPEFDQKLYDSRDAIVAEKNRKIEEFREAGRAIIEKQKNNEVCIYCGSRDTRKSDSFERLGYFGEGGPAHGRRYYCMHCGTFF